MEELAKLKPTLQRNSRRNSVPRAVSYWLFFKRRILEPCDVRVQFEQADPPLDPKQFSALVKALAKPAKWGPSFCRPRGGQVSAPSADRNTREMLVVLYRYYEALLHPASPIYVAESEHVGGLGLFVRRSAAIREGGTIFEGHLWGVPFEVSDEDYAELQARSYPSLYVTPDGRAHIMCGPLALVNHRCAAPLACSLPKKIQTKDNMRGVSLEEFAGLSAVYVQATAHYRVCKDKEMTVDYLARSSRPKKASFAGADCKCCTCVESKGASCYLRDINSTAGRIKNSENS